MTRDSITLSNILPAGCNTAEQYITSIITEARTREGRTLDGFEFNPTEAALCMMLASKAVNDAWDAVPVDDPTASDEDAYLLALDRAFRSIVADRDRAASTEQPAIEQPAIDEQEPAIEQEPAAIEQPTEAPAAELPAVPSVAMPSQPTEEPTAIDEQPAISLPLPTSPRPSSFRIDGQTYIDSDGDYHHLNAQRTLYISIPQTIEDVTSNIITTDTIDALTAAFEQHGCTQIDTPAELIPILERFHLVTPIDDIPAEDADEPAFEQPTTTELPAIDEQPTIELPTAEQPTAPIDEQPEPTTASNPQTPQTPRTPSEVQAVLDTMPDVAAIRKAAANFKMMFSIDAVAHAETIEWTMPDPTHVTLTATESDGTIWCQREDIKNGGRRVTVTEDDGTCTQFKSVGKLIAYLNGWCSLEDAIKSSKKATKPVTAPIEQPAAPVEPAAAPVDEQPAIEQPTIDEQPAAAVEEQPSVPSVAMPSQPEPEPIEQPTTDEQPVAPIEQPADEQPEPKASATAEPMRGKPLPSFHHPKFNDILTLSKAGFAIYMYGPAGTGKSTIVKQCAKAMGLEYTTISSPTMEHKVEGFIDAQGIFRSTEFRDAFEHGKVFDMAEIDNTPSEVLVIMNDALSDGCFAFPDGLVYMHPNFRCFASGNTAGKGADGAYTARKILDAASLDRFELIRIDYDQQVENVIATDDAGKIDTDAIEFVHDFRRVMADCQPNFVVSYRRLKSLVGMVKCFNGDYEKAVRYAIVRELADQKDDLRNIVLSLKANTSNPYYCALRTIVQRLFGKGTKPIAA